MFVLRGRALWQQSLSAASVYFRTKAVSRFHTPEVLELIRERDIIKEKLAAAANAAFADFVSEVASHHDSFRDVAKHLAIADCLLSLATVANQPGYTKPVICDEPIIEVKEGRHPIVETLVSTYVPNDVDLTGDRRCLLITGPNMGGKSSYIRQVALITIMSQIGSYVPADSARVGIFDAVHTRMGACDDITRGQSTFMKELQETSDILKAATNRSLVILDELGRGTSTHDGTAIAYGTLRHLVETTKCLTLFVTHYPVLGKLSGVLGDALRCGHMGFIENDEEKDGAPSVTFLYKLTDGLAARSYGLNVARLASLPEEVISVAAVKSAELEKANNERKTHAQIKFARKAVATLLAGKTPLLGKSDILELIMTDCQKAIELDPHNVKGYYRLGQALLGGRNPRLSEAISALKKAYHLAIEQKVTYVEEIGSAFRKAKARRWEVEDARRREEESDLYRYLSNLIERDRRRQLDQLPDDVSKEDRDAIHDSHDERLSQITALFTQAGENAKKREVPDAFLGKISFELMTDPVITPSGITYDRAEILLHLRKIGHWDPLSRQPLRESDLIPNLALKEAIETFLENNGWAADY
ncbi:Mismatch repair protein msh3 [Blyttiomyces sp. JEL0837]|nr:Mismatch repair protein msh3 [Blyttiomyces sp. JEL0837]